MSSHRTRRVIGAAIAATFGLASIAPAASLYWDDNGATAGGGGTTAVGTWGTSDFWNTDSAGGGTGTGAWTPGETAVFSAGTDVTGNYAITVSETQDAGGLIFEEGQVTLTGGALTLSGTTPSINLTATTSHILSAISAANNVSFTRTGTNLGNLNLGSTNTFAGGITLGGLVRINANAVDALGTGTVTMTGSNNSISGATAGVFNISNTFVLNPLNTANFIAGFTAAGAGAGTTQLNFTNTISGNGDVYILATPSPTNTDSNGNGLTVFSGTNTYTGATVLNMSSAGSFRLGSAGALPAGTSITFGRGQPGTGQNVGLMDLGGQNISITSLSTNTGGSTALGITNADGANGGNITITGGSSTTFGAVIGTLNNASLNAHGFTGTSSLSLTLAAAHTGNLTLSNVNTFTGATNINGGTLTVANAGNTLAGAVNVNSGGTLASSAGTQATIRGIGGVITVNSGGVVSPGGAGIGTLAANGGMTVNGGANFDFDLLALTNYDQINLGTAALTLDSGAHTVDILGTASAGTYTLMNYGSLVSDGTNLFTLGSTPGGAFTYNLATDPTALTLTVTPTVQTLAWDVGGGGPPIVDGASVTPWADGSTDFTDLSTNAGATFSNTGTADIVFGSDAAASGGLVQLGGNVRTGGMLTFGTISAAAPYTIGDPGTTNTLTTVGGITANGAVSTTINAPVVLETSQTWNVTAGSTLVTNATISDGAGGAKTLSKSGIGVLQLLAPANTFSGGLLITAGRVEANSDGAIGPGDVTIDTSGQFRFIAPFSTDNNFVVGSAGGQIFTDAANPATISGTISGPGRLQKEGGGSITLTGTNTFSSLLVGNGMIYVNSEASLGLGDIELDSGGLGASTASWSTSKNILFSGNHFNEDFRTNGFNISVSGVISGIGDLFKYDAGTLVLSGANVYSGNTIIPATGGGGTIRTESATALGTGNLQVRANFTLDVATDLNTRAIRADATITKTGPGLLSLTGNTTNGNVGGTIVVNEGAVQMNSRESLGGVNPAADDATTTQMNIILNSGTELRSNWGSGTPRRGGSITVNNATFRRLATATGENVYNAFNGDAYYGDILTISGNSTLANEQISTGSGVNNLAFDMPVVLEPGAALTMHNANNAGDYDSFNLSLRGTNSTVHSAYDILTMNDGSSIVMTGPGEKRIGGITTGKPIVVNGNATLKLDSRSFLTDLDGSGTGNEFTRLTINGGGGLRIEAPMNASYTTPIDPEPVQQPEEGFTGFFGINTTSTADGGTPPTGYSVIGNAYTIFSPKRANGLAGSTGTITLAATDATDATGLLNHGPAAASPVRLAVDNTAASAGADLVYQIDAAANGATFNNFAGLDVKQSNAGAGSVRAQLINSAARLPSVSVSATTHIDLTDQKLILSAMPAGTFVGSAYDGVAGLVDTARGSAGNALWNGPSGITTSDTRAINNGDLISIGVAKVSDVRTVGDTETTSFAGYTVLGSETLAMVTWGGDANLDGKINIDDYGRIDGNVGQSGSVFGWSKGDFNYDGKINIDDYGIIDGNINRQGAVIPTAGGSGAIEGVAAVPEPAGLSVTALGALGLLRRRRQQR